jgi:hypothetical protein
VASTDRDHPHRHHNDFDAARSGAAEALYRRASQQHGARRTGDDSGTKLIEQRGIDFATAEDFSQSLKAAGASEAFLKALRAAHNRPDRKSRRALRVRVIKSRMLVGSGE